LALARIIFLIQRVIHRSLFQVYNLIRCYRVHTLVHPVLFRQCLMYRTIQVCKLYCVSVLTHVLYTRSGLKHICLKVCLLLKRLIFHVLVFLLYALCRTVFLCLMQNSVFLCVTGLLSNVVSLKVNLLDLNCARRSSHIFNTVFYS
jgi:hypothetical protein